MKNLYKLVFTLFITGLSFGQDLSITEINYNSDSPGIELTSAEGLPFPDLSDWDLVFYKSNGMVDFTIYLGTDLGSDFNKNKLEESIIWINVPNISDGLNNGSGKEKGAAVALIYKDNVIEFLSYNGSFVAKKGPVADAGYTEPSINISIDDPGILGSDQSLQKNVNKTNGWKKFSPTTPGLANNSSKSLSIGKNQIEGFSMYPNPVSNGNVYLTSDSREDKEVEIYALTGQLVYNNVVKSRESMNVSNLNRGIYMVRIIEDGSIATRKLVVN